MSSNVDSKQKCLQITSLSKKGRGCATDSRLEVVGALPGEEVLVTPMGRKKGILKEVLHPSPDRVEPRCSHAPFCGGCAIQQMDYFAQLDLKQERVNSLFEEFGVDVAPIIGCDRPWHYRNKMEYSFSENRAGEKFLGLILAGSRGKVENLKECFLVSNWFTETLDAVRSWWKESALRAYHHGSDRGHLRTLTLREAKQGKGKMVMLTVSGNPEFALKRSDLNAFVKCLPGVDLSVFVQVQQICKGKPTQFFEMLLKGNDHITEKLHVELGAKRHTLECKISPTSFFQPNTLQAERLYEEALSFLDLEGKVVYDLYCGGGMIGLIASKLAKKVVGVEINPHSVFDAGWNQEVNGIENFTIHRGDVGSLLETMEEKPDILIVDPPRAGLDAKAIQEMLRLDAKQILYISCNPLTQRDDIAAFASSGYSVLRVQPIDQFPHTMHIENVVLLEKA